MENAKKLKLEGLKMIKKKHEQKERERKAKAYIRACRIEKAKRKTVMEIIVGSITVFTLICAFIAEINILHNLIHMM